MKTVIYLLPRNYQLDQTAALNRYAFAEHTILGRIQHMLPLLDRAIEPANIMFGMYMPQPSSRLAVLLEVIDPNASQRPVSITYRGNPANAKFFAETLVAHVQQSDPELSNAIGALEPASYGGGYAGGASLGFHIKLTCNLLTDTSAGFIGDAIAAGIVAALPTQ